MSTADDSSGLFYVSANILPNGALEMLSVPYSTSESNGVIVLVITSVVSFIATLGLLTAICLSAWNTRKSTNSNLFVRTNVAPYFVFMLLSDMMQAVGSLMNARWIAKNSVEVGGYCTAQGVIKHVSDIGVAIWALVIASHTFLLLFYRLTIPRWIMITTVVGVHMVLLLITPLGPLLYDRRGRGDFYGIAGYWCWITDNFDKQRITMDYMLMFISAACSFLLYTLVFLRMRGNIVVEGWWFRFRMASTENWRGRDFAAGNAGLAIAKQMLLYPIAYTIIILPIAAARFSEWSGHEVPFGVTIFCDTVFLLSGVVNVTLFTTTRRLLPAQSVLGNWKRFLPSFFSSSARALTGKNKEQDPTSATFDEAEKSFVKDKLTTIDIERSAGAQTTQLETVVETPAESAATDNDSFYIPCQGRLKIDNHVDTTLSNSDGSRSVRSSFSSINFAPMQAPPAALLPVDRTRLSPLPEGSRSQSPASSYRNEHLLSAEPKVFDHRPLPSPPAPP